MGYFAILSPKIGAAPEVLRTHINLWSLPSLIPGRRLFYFDVGVEVAAGTEPVSSVEMMLPFRVEEGKWPDGSRVVQDLFDSVTHDDTSELIFGGPVQHRSDGRKRYLRIGDYPEELRVIRVNVAETKRVDSYASRTDSSLYTVELDERVEPGERAYFRIRWRVFGAYPLWRWKRLSGGARVDLRVCDVRESRFAAIDRYVRPRILEIRQVNIFLMASPKLQLASHSPSFRYLRILEPGAWKQYLRGAPHIGGVRGLLVYYWRHPLGTGSGEAGSAAKGTRAISMDDPFRVFLDFNRAASATWWMQVLRVVFGVILALFLIKGTQTLELSEWDLRGVEWWTLVKALVGTTLLAWISTWDKVRRWAAGGFLVPRRLFRGLERAILSLGK